MTDQFLNSICKLMHKKCMKEKFHLLNDEDQKIIVINNQVWISDNYKCLYCGEKISQNYNYNYNYNEKLFEHAAIHLENLIAFL